MFFSKEIIYLSFLGQFAVTQQPPRVKLGHGAEKYSSREIVAFLSLIILEYYDMYIFVYSYQI